jgi:hypothetical protein
MATASQSGEKRQPDGNKKSLKRGAEAQVNAEHGASAVPVAKRRREEKPQRALRREERRLVMAEAKATWESMRPKAVDAEKTAKLVTKLCELLGGRIAEFVFRHDGSRIVQWMLADASDKQKASIMDELLKATCDSGTGEEGGGGAAAAPFFVRLACDRYGRHLAMKLLRVATKQHRAAIFEKYLRGNTAALIRNSYGADVLDFAFQTVLNARHRADLVVELLFSREKAMFDVVRAKCAGKADGGVQGDPKITFEAALDLVGESFKDVVVESAGAVLAPLIDKDATVRLAIVHAALDEYLTVLMKQFPAEKSRLLCGQLAPSMVHLAHTKPGVSCAVNCIKILDAKHRKKAVRSLKGHVRALIIEEYGHRLLIAMFEWIDDTKLVGKAVTAELFTASKIAADIALQNDDDDVDMDPESKTLGTDCDPSKANLKKSKKMGNQKRVEASSGGALDLEFMESICLHKHGRMLLLSMLFPRDSRYFNPDVYGHIWNDIDEAKFGKMSKKDEASRRQELLVQFTDVMGQIVVKSFRTLLGSHWSAPLLIGSLHIPSLVPIASGATVTALQAVLRGEAENLAKSLCARKTISTMMKVGGTEFCETVLAGLGTDAESDVWQAIGWESVSIALLSMLSQGDAGPARSGPAHLNNVVDVNKADGLPPVPGPRAAKAVPKQKRKRQS